MKPVSVVMAVISMALVAGIVWVLGPGARWVLEHIDGVAIGEPSGLVGKDLAAALDAVRGRVLAVATGLAALVAVYYTARNADTARRTFQLGERGHVTDRYGKAVEQLGSAEAPVRLGGLYALEQLAQDNPDPHFRQTIVDVICAYLRMPYTPPPDDPGQDQFVGPRASDDGVPASAGRGPFEEREVRLTAQRILAAHLRYVHQPARNWWRSRSSNLNARHWPDIRLDLTGAALIDFDLRGCRVGEALFGGATFTGNAQSQFAMVTFTGDAHFVRATFTGDAWFDGATFTGDALFSGATFTGGARFDEATFTRDARFLMAAFTRDAWFARTTFTRNARFSKTTFTGDARFDEATFTRDAHFGMTTFTGEARFERATFTGGARFPRTRFTGDARFERATFTGDALFAMTTFTGDARFNEATFTRDAWFRGARGLERAQLDQVRVAPGSSRRVWPRAWQMEVGADGWATLRLAPLGGDAEAETAQEQEPEGLT